MYSISLQHVLIALAAIAGFGTYLFFRQSSGAPCDQAFDSEEPYGVRFPQDELDPANPDNLMVREAHHNGIYPHDHQSWSDSSDQD